MTPSDLKYHVAQTGSHFFDRKTMQFFGDTMSNYGCYPDEIETKKWNGRSYQDGLTEKVLVWTLWRKQPIKHGLQENAYFRRDNYARVIRVPSIRRITFTRTGRWEHTVN